MQIEINIRNLQKHLLILQEEEHEICHLRNLVHQAICSQPAAEPMYAPHLTYLEELEQRLKKRKDFLQDTAQKYRMISEKIDQVTSDFSRLLKE